MKNEHYFLAIGIYVLLSYVLALLGRSAELAGFAVVGALALVFLKLDSFKEFSGGGFSAKLKERVDDIEKDLAPIKSKAIEPEEVENTLNKTKFDEGLSKKALQVLDALVEGNYSWRTFKGLEASTKIPKSELEEILTELEADMLVTTTKSSAGKVIWGATSRGHVTYSVEHATYE